jgi:hypothetical protein
MGIKAIKGLGKAFLEGRKEFLKAQENIYKLDKTGKKDKIIKSMNKTMKEKKHSAGPGMIDNYQKVMTSDFEKKTGPFFDNIRAREKAKRKAAELKKLKGKK